MTDAGERALIDRLLDLIEAENAGRQDFLPAIPRDKAAAILARVPALYGCREGSAASIYALVALDDEIGFKAEKPISATR